MKAGLRGRNEHLLQRLRAQRRAPGAAAHLLPTLLKEGFLYGRLASSLLSRARLPLQHHVASGDRGELFDEVAKRRTPRWNALLRGTCGAGKWGDTLVLFRCMLAEAYPDEFTLPIVLRACAGLSALGHGKALHGFAVRSRAEVVRSDLFVGSALVAMYAKCGEMGSAVKVFWGYPQPDVPLWTSVVTAYQQNQMPEEAVSFFSQVLIEKMYLIPNTMTLVSLVSAIAQCGGVISGKCCHGYALRRGFYADLPLCNSLLNMYTKLGSPDLVQKLFAAMSIKDVITWSCMAGFLAREARITEALGHYKRMISEGFLPNSVTVISILQACALGSNVQEGRKVHEYAIQKGFELQVAVATALVDMYMKCSCFKEAEDIFSRMPRKDVVSWAALINGYTLSGLPDKSLIIFQNMLSTSVKLDAVVMVKVIAACSELGVLHQSLCIHGFLVRRGFNHRVFVGAALVDMYSKCGSLENSIKAFESAEEKGVVLWSSLIAAYGMHGLGDAALLSFEQMIESSVRPNDITFVSLLSACSHSGLLNVGKWIFREMQRTFGVSPVMEHYSAMVDLLGRAGELPEALQFIEQIPSPVDPHIWSSFLAGCRIHGNLEMGGLAAKNLFKLSPDHGGYCLSTLDMLASCGKWDSMTKMRILVKRDVSNKSLGHSLIGVNNKIYTFLAGERSHEDLERLCEVLRSLEVIREEGFVCDLSTSCLDESWNQSDRAYLRCYLDVQGTYYHFPAKRRTMDDF